MVAAGAMALAVTGCAGQRGAEDVALGSDGPTDSLEWTPCDIGGTPAEQPPAEQSPAATGTGTASPRKPECARLKVPLDYAKPEGDTIEIALVRIPATGPGQRIGSLVFNFGGPGGSGVDTLVQAAPRFSTLNTRYDLVGFDPRGVGLSAPVNCLDDAQIDAGQQTESTPNTPQEIATFEAELRNMVNACVARSGRLLPHVGTVNAARDMDRLRVALGQRTLDYFGISYGTMLGANYAHQFPENVGRTVLDAAVDTKLDKISLGLQQAAGFQLALQHYAEACVKAGPQLCSPAKRGATKDVKTPEEIVNDVGNLLKSLERKPLETTLGRRLSQTLGMSGVATALYSRQLWPALSQGLTMAEQGDGTILLTLADVQSGRDENGHFSNIMAANTAITCADTTERRTVADVRRVLPKFRNASPVFGESMAWGVMQCTGWPVPGDDSAKEVSAKGSPPILVLGNTGDPATPYAWAPALARELGTGVLVTLKGEGHGSYDTGDPCVRAAVDGYLLEGKVPRDGTRCG
ncbi:alpha/beta hydrolase [Spongiactinospora sp. TRM90649]|uniref:alpha/beta hydrolase n=1 Tax=Spongiactinospora sp. TRM90649 TaxID=3031114 RepID=UPI0023FA4B32|nr:alpha/beta hydrolase [Spongiactinospora sp. TRM90649]MDF5752284.1 alpha/beta hydrolase [Spongiactinospora sp. TRM90649]